MTARPQYDLHCHSTASDGVLTPAALVRRAAERGVDVLALTDHDEVSGLAEAASTAAGLGLAFVPGTELSVSWRDVTIHIVGLRIDPSSSALQNGMRKIRAGRRERGMLMGDALARHGIPDAYEGALAFAANADMLSRTHFARFLVESGHCRDVREVFKRYLTPGKPGYVEHVWASLGDAIELIHTAGGQAVLAHPGRYKVNRTALRDLLTEFKDFGGDALEVLTSSHTETQSREFVGHALRFGFLASCGSDFHGPGESWLDFGDLPPLPEAVTPVWQNWPAELLGMPTR
jgi:predicted metal-dependent phosphoesterase TrpH